MNNEEILLFRKPYGVCNGHYYCVEFLKMAHTHGEWAKMENSYD